MFSAVGLDGIADTDIDTDNTRIDSFSAFSSGDTANLSGNAAATASKTHNAAPFNWQLQGQKLSTHQHTQNHKLSSSHALYSANVSNTHTSSYPHAPHAAAAASASASASSSSSSSSSSGASSLGGSGGFGSVLGSVKLSDIPRIRILCLGDSGVGKSSFIQRLCEFDSDSDLESADNDSHSHSHNHNQTHTQMSTQLSSKLHDTNSGLRQRLSSSDNDSENDANDCSTDGVMKNGASQLSSVSSPISSDYFFFSNDTTVGCKIFVKLFRAWSAAPFSTGHSNLLSSPAPSPSKFSHYFVEFLDIAGHRKFSLGRSIFYSNFHGIIFFFDSENDKSYENIRKWIRELIRAEQRKSVQNTPTHAATPNYRKMTGQRNTDQNTNTQECESNANELNDWDGTGTGDDDDDDGADDGRSADLSFSAWKSASEERRFQSISHLPRIAVGNKIDLLHVHGANANAAANTAAGQSLSESELAANIFRQRKRRSSWLWWLPAFLSAPFHSLASPYSADTPQAANPNSADSTSPFSSDSKSSGLPLTIHDSVRHRRVIHYDSMKDYGMNSLFASAVDKKCDLNALMAPFIHKVIEQRFFARSAINTPQVNSAHGGYYSQPHSESNSYEQTHSQTQFQSVSAPAYSQKRAQLLSMSSATSSSSAASGSASASNIRDVTKMNSAVPLSSSSSTYSFLPISALGITIDNRRTQTKVE